MLKNTISLVIKNPDLLSQECFHINVVFYQINIFNDIWICVLSVKTVPMVEIGDYRKGKWLKRSLVMLYPRMFSPM